MTSANGVTRDAGQHPCDGYVDNLKPTVSITIIYFLIQGHNLKKTVHSLPTTHKQIVPKAK